MKIIFLFYFQKSFGRPPDFQTHPSGYRVQKRQRPKGGLPPDRILSVLCFSILLFFYSTVFLFFCFSISTVFLFFCFSILLFCYSSILLFLCFAFLMFRFSYVSLFLCFAFLRQAVSAKVLPDRRQRLHPGAAEEWKPAHAE